MKETIGDEHMSLHDLKQLFREVTIVLLKKSNGLDHA